MTITATSIEQFKTGVSLELENILKYWMKYTLDEINGGFVGKIDHAERVYPEAPKGSVLNSRILWSFSAAFNLTKNQEYLSIARRSFDYILRYFFDKDYGGVYWTVDYKGNPLDTKKQIYALSFAVYGLTEYYKASNDELAKETAISLYNDIVDHSYDKKFGGYTEALTRDWKEVTDLRLSVKDANEKKSMNTHLHVLEAFSNLLKVWPDPELRKRVKELVNIFLDHIISKRTNHLVLFFDEEWKERSGTISYGHDIEAAWLIQEAAATLDGLTLAAVKKRSVDLANAAAKGLDSDGGMWYEYDPVKKHLIKEKHSWPQAEAMVGFFNAFQITGDEKYLKQSFKSWQFVQQHMRDTKCGEWHWGVKEDYSLMLHEDKVGIWKCPYHNSRACIEIIDRINGLLDLRRN